jgi:hypothetical protein
MRRNRNVDPAEYHGDFYNKTPSKEAKEPIDTAISTLIPTDFAPSSSRPNADGRLAVKSELTASHDAYKQNPKKDQSILEPKKPVSTLEVRTAIAGLDPCIRQLPEWKLVQLDSIFIHPLLAGTYQQQGIQFPPAAPGRYLTGHGMLRIARYLPIQLVKDGTRLLCFGGLRLYLAVLANLAPTDSIEAVVSASISDAEVVEAIYIEEQIFGFWFRQTRDQRKANEQRHFASDDPHDLTYHDQDQQQLSELFKTCTRTIQTRVASRRKAPKP